jgi:hypothetical protein
MDNRIAFYACGSDRETSISSPVRTSSQNPFVTEDTWINLVINLGVSTVRSHGQLPRRSRWRHWTRKITPLQHISYSEKWLRATLQHVSIFPPFVSWWYHPLSVIWNSCLLLISRIVGEIITLLTSFKLIFFCIRTKTRVFLTLSILLN